MIHGLPGFQDVVLCYGQRGKCYVRGCLLVQKGVSGQLGFGAVVGDAIYDPQAGIRIRIGPLSRKRYAEFLPGGSAREQLYEFVRFYADDYLDVELQLVLKGDEVPLCQLGEELDSPLALGWYTWLPSRGPLARDPDDTVLSLDRE